VIADGHHRYETALNYRKERPTHAGKIDPDALRARHDELFNTRSEGLTILPGHRGAAHIHDFSWSGVRRHLEPWFAAEAFPVFYEEKKAEAQKKFLGKLAVGAQETGDRRYPQRSRRSRLLRIDAARGGQAWPCCCKRFAAAARTGRSAAAEGIWSRRWASAPQAVTAEAKSHLRAEARCGIRCRGPRPRANSRFF